MLRLLSSVLLVVTLSNPVAAQAPSGSSASDFVRIKGKPEVIQASVHLVRQAGGEALHLIVGDSAYVGLGDVVEFRAAGTYYQILGVNTTNTSIVQIEELLLQRTEEGPLDLYVHANQKAPDPDSYAFDYFAVGNERPRLASTSNLRTVLGDYPESAKALHRAQLFGRMQYGTAIAGGALFLYGLFRGLNGEADAEGNIPGFKINLFQGVGLGTMLLTFGPRHEKKRAWREAITAYQNQ